MPEFNFRSMSQGNIAFAKDKDIYGLDESA